MRIKFRVALFLAVLWSSLVASLPVARAADAPPDAAVWSEYSLGEATNLKALVRVKQIASLADSDWLQIEITNNGTAAKIKDFSIEVPAAFGNRSTSSLVSVPTIGVASARPNMRSIGYTIPVGKFNTAEPGVQAARVFGSPPADLSADLPVTARIIFKLVLDDGRTIATPSEGVTIQFTWTSPKGAQLDSLQKELVALLAKTVRGNGPPSPDAVGGAHFSPYLSRTENARLSSLLQMPAVTKAVTLDQALATLKQRELDDSLLEDPYNWFMWMVDAQWPHDPALIAFYRDAIVNRGDGAIMELFSPMPGIWDDSFVELLVKGLEARALRLANPPVPAPARGRPGTTSPPPPHMTYSTEDVFEDGFNVLDRHYAAWAKDESIPPRLSKAVLTAYPSLTGNTSSGAPLGSQTFSNAMMLLGHTHDRAMIAILRPFLSNKTVDGNGVESLKHTPLRVCEMAANAIYALLGEPPPYMGMEPGVGNFPPGPYAEWDEWDQQNAALAQRLDAMPKDEKPPAP